MPRNTIKLTAESDYQAAGRQYIGRVTGPSDKFGIVLDFVGLKSGKRGEVTAIVVASPGCYKVHDANRKGGSDCYWLIWVMDDVLVQTGVSQEDATLLAQDLTTETIEALGRRIEIADTESSLSASRTKDPEALVDVGAQTALELGIAPGKRRRADVIAAREHWLHRIRAPRTASTAARSMLEHRRAELQRELAEIEAALRQEDPEVDAP